MPAFKFHSVSVVIALGKRPVTFRTRKLSLSAPMVLQGGPCGRVGRRRTPFTGKPRVLVDTGLFCVHEALASPLCIGEWWPRVRSGGIIGTFFTGGPGWRSRRLGF